MHPSRRYLLAALIMSFAAEPVTAVEQISVLALFRDKAMVEIDGKRRMLVKGKPSPEGVRLVSASSRGAVLEVDGKEAEYALGQRIATTYAQPAQRQALRIWPTGDGMYQANGSINGLPVRFLVDTGATLIAMNKHVARRLGIDFRVRGTEGRATTASGVVRTYTVQLDRVRLGDIELREVAASVVDGDFPQEVLLGNSFLNRLDLRRDGRALELRTRDY